MLRGIVAVSHLLSEDIQKIVDTPETLNSLRKNLQSMDQALASLQAVSDAQSKHTTASYGESCDRFRTDLSRWTRHREDGKLSLRDCAMVGFFKQGYVKSMSEQLQIQHWKITLTSVVCIATL
ncbi:hypothetical protein C8A05DRAFT_44247 [Staphylotrichum tortipilum]|uniref:Azaphilone pigments biosynthesis cluster protein L N-terminal domain-containing protein n=1 Tax=Staphylotrichum tortipilum TaxID=2831512 RepID=A0AAN6ML92_9PEZI|nr:hypothetical protein C8A05DRAFT_44247 [Staphylotrichum longicolle]